MSVVRINPHSSHKAPGTAMALAHRAAIIHVTMVTMYQTRELMNSELEYQTLASLRHRSAIPSQITETISHNHAFPFIIFISQAFGFGSFSFPRSQRPH